MRSSVQVATAAALALAACGGRAARPERTHPAEEVSGPAILRGRVQFDDGTTPREFVISVTFDRDQHRFSDGTGRFEITLDHPRRGPHLVFVKGPGFATPNSCVTPGPIELSRGRVTDVGTIVVDRGGTVRGRVVGVDGRPAGNATVVTGAHWFRMAGRDLTGIEVAGGRLSGDQTATTRPDGTFELTGLAGQVTVIAVDDAERFSLPLRLRADATGTPVELAIVQPAVLEGTISDFARGHPAVVSARSIDSRLSFTTETEPDGRFRLDSLPPGHYEVELVYRSDYWVTRPSTQVSVAGPTSQVMLDGQVAGRLVVHARPAPTDAHERALVVMPGTVAATKWHEVEAAIGDLQRRHTTAMVMQGVTSLDIETLAPGEYTACGAAYAAETRPRSGCRLLDNVPGDAPAVCRTFTVAAGDPERVIELELSP